VRVRFRGREFEKIDVIKNYYHDELFKSNFQAVKILLRELCFALEIKKRNDPDAQLKKLYNEALGVH